MGIFAKGAKTQKGEPSAAGDGAVVSTDGAASKKVQPAVKKPKVKSSKKGFNFFAADVPGDKPLSDPELEYKRFRRVSRRVIVQAILLTPLVGFFIFGTKIFEPGYEYYARRIGAPLGSEKRLIELEVPVLTKEAILSWSMTTATEILTYNFADYNQRISMFASRFTPDGWSAFVAALYKEGTIDKFKAFQLVSTAAPSGSATITKEGENPETLEYEWEVKIPIVRTFITNNEKSDVRNYDVVITLVRVPIEQYPSGIAIKVWQER